MQRSGSLAVVFLTLNIILKKEGKNEVNNKKKICKEEKIGGWLRGASPRVASCVCVPAPIQIVKFIPVCVCVSVSVTTRQRVDVDAAKIKGKSTWFLH